MKNEFLKDNSIGSTNDIQAPPGKINFKTTERFVGFLVYVSQTYTSFVPYLKDMHLTLNSWCLGRDTNGWPLMEYKRDGDGIHHEDLTPPLWVNMVPQFKLDMHALLVLTCYKDPPEIPVRSKSKNATYIVGNALGTGFGLCR